MTGKNGELRVGATVLTKEEKRLLKRLRRQVGYDKKSEAEKAKLDVELVEIAKNSLARKSDETKFAKNVAVAARHSAKVYFKARWRFLTFLVTASFVLLLAAYVLYAYVFIIDSVEITGNERYTSETLSAACGINVGDKLFGLSVDEDELTAALKKQFPYIKSAELKRVIPNRVVITVVEEAPAFVSEIYGQYALISSELRVLELTEEKPDTECIRLVLPDVKNAVEGQVIEFKTDVFGVVKKACDAVMSESMAEGTSLLNIADRFNIWIAYENRYKLMIGDINDIEVKLTLAFEIMKDEVFEGGNKGTIYLDNINSPSVIIDNGITFE